MKPLFDSNILIDYLNGIEAAATELARFERPMISRITWMEVLAGGVGTQEEEIIRTFLRRFVVVELNDMIAERAVTLRRDRRLRLPDAIILASAMVEGCTLVTRNTRDFDPAWPDVNEPYGL